MKTYKVTTAHATFGIGVVLKLTEEQSSIRQHALIKKGKNVFEVKEPIQFKHAEVINLVKGTLSRFLEERLEEVQKKEAKPKTAQSENKTNDQQDKPTEDEFSKI